MKNRGRSLICMFVALMLVLSTFALAGCTGSSDEQDNCYGQDVPVVNE